MSDNYNSESPHKQTPQHSFESPKLQGGKFIGKNYVLEKTVGEGAFGKVFLGKHLQTNESVAIKTMEKERIRDQADLERIAREIHILKRLRHPNVIQLYDVFETEQELHLIMEYASGGELFEHIVANSRLEEREACRLYHQLITGIEYIHNQSVVHRDLKPENLLLDSYKNLKIADFGLGNSYSKEELLKTACGSPCYAAPEMIEGKKYNGLMADIWSSGVVLFAMICGYLPFEDPDTSTLYQKIVEGKYEIPSHLSDDAADLLEKVLNVDPEKRWKIEEIRSHKWMRALKDERLIRVKEIKGVYNNEINEKVVEIMQNSGFKREELLKNLRENKRNNVTGTYYLLLSKEVRLINEKIDQILQQNMQESQEKTRHKTWSGKKKKALNKAERRRKFTIEPQTKIPLEEVFRKLNSYEPERLEETLIDEEESPSYEENSVDLSENAMGKALFDQRKSSKNSEKYKENDGGQRDSEILKENREDYGENREILIENREISIEKREITIENKEISKENKEISQENKEIYQEIKEITKEIQEIPHQQNKEIYQENKEIPEEKKEILKEIQDISQENKEIPQENKEISKEIQEIPEEKKEIPKEIQEIPQENKEIPQENKEIYQISKEIQAIPQEKKEIPQEIKEIPIEINEISKEIQEIPEENKNKEIPRENKEIPQENNENSRDNLNNLENLEDVTLFKHESFESVKKSSEIAEKKEVFGSMFGKSSINDEEKDEKALIFTTTPSNQGKQSLVKTEDRDPKLISFEEQQSFKEKPRNSQEIAKSLDFSVGTLVKTEVFQENVKEIEKFQENSKENPEVSARKSLEIKKLLEGEDFSRGNPEKMEESVEIRRDSIEIKKMLEGEVKLEEKAGELAGNQGNFVEIAENVEENEKIHREFAENTKENQEFDGNLEKTGENTGKPYQISKRNPEFLEQNAANRQNLEEIIKKIKENQEKSEIPEEKQQEFPLFQTEILEISQENAEISENNGIKDILEGNTNTKGEKPVKLSKTPKNNEKIAENPIESEVLLEKTPAISLKNKENSQENLLKAQRIPQNQEKTEETPAIPLGNSQKLHQSKENDESRQAKLTNSSKISETSQEKREKLARFSKKTSENARNSQENSRISSAKPQNLPKKAEIPELPEKTSGKKPNSDNKEPVSSRNPQKKPEVPRKPLTNPVNSRENAVTSRENAVNSRENARKLGKLQSPEPHSTENSRKPAQNPAKASKIPGKVQKQATPPKKPAVFAQKPAPKQINRPIKEESEALEEKSLEKKSARKKNPPKDGLLERVYDILRKDKLIFKAIAQPIGKNAGKLARNEANPKKNEEKGHKHSFSLHANQEIVGKSKEIKGNSNGFRPKSVNPAAKRENKANVSVREERSVEKYKRNFDESIDRKREIAKKQEKRDFSLSMEKNTARNNMMTPAWQKKKVAAKPKPKEHVGSIDLRSFSSKSPCELFEELTTACENLSLIAVRLSEEKVKLKQENLEILISISTFQDLESLTMISFELSQGPKDSYAQACTALLKYLKI